MSRLKKAGVAGGATATIVALAISTVGSFEGLRLKAYRDIVGVPTVCYGETRGVRMGQSYTKPQCDAMLLKGLNEFADGIERCTPGLAKITESAYVAHLSLAFNIGQGAYCKSTAARLVREGRIIASCDALTKFNRAGGREVAGLTRRRAEERALCRKGLSL